MEQKYNARFLGANTPEGFISLFDELYDPAEDWRAYIIKGGPGTGKSRLMRRVADELEQAGYTAQRVLCSSDPDSLDGVIFPHSPWIFIAFRTILQHFSFTLYATN